MTTTTLHVPRPHGGALSGAIASEWVKLRTVRSTLWNVLSGIALTGLVATQAAINLDHEGGTASYSEPAVSAIQFSQFVVAALAMLVITSEYSTGSIRSTLQWTPERHTVLAAKAIVVAPATFVVGIVLAATGSLAAIPWLDGTGTSDLGPLVENFLLIGSYVMLVSLFTLGLGTMIRSAAGTLTTIFLLLLVAPMLLVSSENDILRGIGNALPGGAGNAFLTQNTDQWGPSLALVILVAWVCAALLAAAVTLRARDA